MQLLLPPREHSFRAEELTQEHVKRLIADWSRYAKEPVSVEVIAGAAYGFGSEVACLRLYAVYRMPLKTRVEFSTNRKQWFFSLELS